MTEGTGLIKSTQTPANGLSINKNASRVEFVLSLAFDLIFLKIWTLNVPANS